MSFGNAVLVEHVIINRRLHTGSANRVLGTGENPGKKGKMSAGVGRYLSKGPSVPLK